MRIESALYSSSSGLSASGQAIAVIGDDVANANTTGFKRSRIEFQDLVSSGPNGYKENSDAIGGNGVMIDQIRVMHAPGSLEATDRALDFGIDGAGMFILKNGNEQFYSRAGLFRIDSQGLLVNSDGLAVQGYAPTDTNHTTLTNLDMLNPASEVSATSTINVLGNFDASADTTTVPVNPTTFREAGQNASFVTELRAIDSLGDSHPLQITAYKTAGGAWTVQAYMDGGEVAGQTAGTPVRLGSVDLNFNGAGAIPAANQAAAVLTLTPQYINGADVGNIKIDLSQLTQFANVSQFKSVTNDGQGVGNLVTFKVENDGRVYGLLDNDSRALIGTIALADFPNYDGLKRVGSTLFKSTEDTGTMLPKIPGGDGIGIVKNGQLEHSTVDIANEFTDLVIYQRAYQGNSQVLSNVSDRMKQTIDLMR